MSKRDKILAGLGLVMAIISGILLINWIWLGGFTVVIEAVGLILFVAFYHDNYEDEYDYEED